MKLFSNIAIKIKKNKNYFLMDKAVATDSEGVLSLDDDLKIIYKKLILIFLFYKFNLTLVF